jgi:hypothetical protein
MFTFADSTFSTAGNFNTTGLTPGIYTVTAVFVEAGCFFPASVNIEITELPDASFTLMPDPVCVDGLVGADAGAEMVGWNYVWSVNDAAATVTETSPTTRNISWPTAGTKEVSLMVRDVNGCEAQSTESVGVVAPLQAPVISCGNSSFTSVEFNWATETGVDSFMVTVNGGVSFFQDSTSFIQAGLIDGQFVRIIRTAPASQRCRLPSMWQPVISTLLHQDFSSRAVLPLALPETLTSN